MGKGTGKFIAGAVAGAAVGAAAGVLFAPKAGVETRRELKAKLDELYDKVKDIKFSDITESVQRKIEELRKELNELDKEKVLKVARRKADEVKKKSQEIYELALEKGNAALQATAKEIRAKALAVAKDTVERLEKEEK